MQRPQNSLASKSPSKYVAQRGDTYSSIARKFDVELADLKKWNRQNLVPGMKVVLSQAGR
ncbi:LysM domain-containing protein [Deefgea sp. CFH1-16]|uniref:LysM peptidoglycan-binding domain-containing protein n=1 Tax=Deefgea sp. CFH1-16 TaxID=2675457 RepID=UPI0015F6748B